VIEIAQVSEDSLTHLLLLIVSSIYGIQKATRRAGL